ncbi:MAG: ISAs1 family transposase, partial [Pseudonocardiaceae bacterium]
MSRPLRKLFARLDADALDRTIGAWMWTRTGVAEGRRVIALDGKTVRGARRKDKAAPHLVAAFDHAAGAVLGQLQVTDKSNEIPCVRTLLATLDLAGAVVTLDAMHTQKDTSRAITDAGGDFVFTVKANTPTLHRQLKQLPWKDVPAHSSTKVGHGRRVTRTIKVSDAPAWVAFPGAAQVAQLRRTVTKKGNKTVEVVYLITSA